MQHIAEKQIFLNKTRTHSHTHTRWNLPPMHVTTISYVKLRGFGGMNITLFMAVLSFGIFTLKPWTGPGRTEHKHNYLFVYSLQTSYTQPTTWNEYFKII